MLSGAAYKFYSVEPVHPARLEDSVALHGHTTAQTRLGGGGIPFLGSLALLRIVDVIKQAMLRHKKCV